MVVHKYELTYPRQFNFAGAANFTFSLPASTTGRYLEIIGFSYGLVAPVLYDLTNGRRYTADISSPGLVRIILPSSAAEQTFVLVSEDATNVSSINALQQRNFINYFNASNQGNYLIISNNQLYNGANGTNPVEEYRAYRSSAVGGGYNAKVVEIDELVDQFAFGIKNIRFLSAISYGLHDPISAHRRNTFF
jgi:hypothetical protein